MKRFLASIGIGLIFVNAFGAPTDAVVKQLNANYAAMAAAFKHKDISAFSKYYSPKYEAKQRDGTVITRVKVIADIQVQMNSLTNVDWTRKVATVVVKGKQVVATVNGSLKATTPPDPKGKKHRIEITTVAENTWDMTGKTWTIISAKAIKRSGLQDGKALPGAGPTAKPAH